MKNFKVFLLISTLFVLTFTNIVLAGWIQDGEFWKYEENGTFKTKDWLTIEGDNYYFDESSHMVTTLYKIGENYYAFHSDGKAYRKKEDFELNGVEYDIGSKGKVMDLELDMSEEQYKEYLYQKAIEDANNKAFEAEQKTYNESVAAEMAKKQKEMDAIKESQKAVDAANQKLIEESKKARSEFLLSAENDQKLVAATNRGNASKAVVDNVYKEVQRQLNLRKLELIGQAKELRKANPMAELSPIVEDFNDIVNTYAKRVDEILSMTEYKYKVNEDKMEGYVDQFASLLEEIKSSFNTALDNQLG